MRLTQNFKLLGVVFLALLLGGVYLTYAIFTKKFTDYDEVTLQTSNDRPAAARARRREDPRRHRRRGARVRHRRPTAPSSPWASTPSELDTIPANVTGSIVPKTLFGEKYVSLEVPEDPSPDPIEAGAVIERTEVAIEVEKVLSDLYPLLRTVQPAEINKTLNAHRDRARGPRRAASARTSRPSTATSSGSTRRSPSIVEDLRLTAQVSDTYADVMPEIAEILRQHDHDDRHARGPRGQGQRAVHRRRRVLRHRARLPRATTATT